MRKRKVMRFEQKFANYSSQRLLNSLKQINDLKNYRDENQLHIFSWAINQRDIKIFRFLLEKCGPNILIDSNHTTPLIQAVKLRRINYLNEIRAHPDVKLHKKDYYGWTALHYAINRNIIQAAIPLINSMSASELQVRTGRGFISGRETALHLAAMGGCNCQSPPQ